MMNDLIRAHCSEIDRCNQRGGRMLSVVDLIEAGTISRQLAAYSLAAIKGGASFLVGALPGGAGKTTVMGALLNFVPRDVRLAPADGMAAIHRGAKAPTPRRCYICHEIGQGPYYAYLWGRDLRAYFDLPDAGHMLATNLHADTYDQACQQICSQSGVQEAALRRMNLMFFLSVRRGASGTLRRIDQVWESDGLTPHRQVFSDGAPESPIRSTGLVSAPDAAKAAEIIDRSMAGKARTIEEVRTVLLAEDE